MVDYGSNSNSQIIKMDFTKPRQPWSLKVKKFSLTHSTKHAWLFFLGSLSLEGRESLLKFFTPRYMYRYVHCSVLWMIQGWVSIPICKLSAESPLWDKMVSVKGRPNKIFTLKDPRRFFTLSYFFVASYQAQFKIRGYIYNFLQTPHITYKVTLHMMGSPDSVHNRESYW